MVSSPMLAVACRPWALSFALNCPRRSTARTRASSSSTLDGFTVCHRLRAFSTVPIIMATRGDHDDRHGGERAQAVADGKAVQRGRAAGACAGGAAPGAV